MPAFSAPGSVTRSRIIPIAAAVGIYLSGCAMEPLPDIGRATTACRANSIAYCEIDHQLDIEKCRCVWRGGIRDSLRNLPRL
jgi:hypothetical protein